MSDYNDDPVNYCVNCLSLKVKDLDMKNNEKIAFCGNCGDTSIYTVHIEEWNEMYYQMYGEYYIKRNKGMGGKRNNKKFIP